MHPTLKTDCTKLDVQMIKELIKSCNEIGAKLVQKSTRSVMNGGYYIIVDQDE